MWKSHGSKTWLHAGRTSRHMAFAWCWTMWATWGRHCVAAWCRKWVYPQSWGPTEYHTMGGALQRFLSSSFTIGFTHADKWFAFVSVLIVCVYQSRSFNWKDFISLKRCQWILSYNSGQNKQKIRRHYFNRRWSGRYWCWHGNNPKKINGRLLKVGCQNVQLTRPGAGGGGTSKARSS